MGVTAFGESGASNSVGTGLPNPTHTLASAPAEGTLMAAAVSSAAAQTAANGWIKIAEQVSADTFAVYRKAAEAGEPAQQTPCTVPSGNWACGIATGTSSTGWPSDPVEAQTSNVDDDATKATTGTCDPTDGVERFVFMASGSDGARTATGVTLNGSATGITGNAGSAVGTAASGTAVGLAVKVEDPTVSGNYSCTVTWNVGDNGAVFLVVFAPNPPAAAKAPPPRQRTWRPVPRRRVA